MKKGLHFGGQFRREERGSEKLKLDLRYGTADGQSSLVESAG